MSCFRQRTFSPAFGGRPGPRLGGPPPPLPPRTSRKDAFRVLLRVGLGVVAGATCCDSTSVSGCDSLHSVML